LISNVNAATQLLVKMDLINLHDSMRIFITSDSLEQHVQFSNPTVRLHPVYWNQLRNLYLRTHFGSSKLSSIFI